MTELTYLCLFVILKEMRTTLRLDDDLLQEAKRYATEHGITLTALMDRALRETLSRDDWSGPGPETRPLPTYSGRGLRPGIDLDDGAALLDLMEVGDDSA